MDTIVQYLKNPLAVGVFNLRITADFSEMQSYLSELLSKEQKLFSSAVSRRKFPASIRKRQEERFARFSEMLSELSETDSIPFTLMPDKHYDEKYFRKITNLLRAFSRFDPFPENLGKWFYSIRELELSSKKSINVKS